MNGRYVDFRAVKERVSIEAVLTHYSVQLRRVNQHTLRGKCPLPAHSSESSRNSFSTALERNIWACQSASCAAARKGKKGGNVLDLVAAMEDCSVREAALKLDDWFPASGAPAAGKGSEGREELVTKKGDEVPELTENTPLTFSLNGIDPTHPYFENRGITEETARHFGVGFFPGRGSMTGRVVIPISNERGELVAYAGRSIDASDPKYKFPAGFRKSEELWNLDRVRGLIPTSEMVIVVEGFFDCMKVHQAGALQVVALMGSSLSDAQEKLLVAFPRVLLFLDGDEAGREATTTIAERLMSQTFLRTVQVADGVQPDQLPSEEIRKILSF